MEFMTIIGNIFIIKDIGTNVLAPFMKKRTDLLREVLFTEFRQGDFSRVLEDDKIAICYRLTRDAMEGVAKNNLRLMARLICGLSSKEELTATNFQKYAKFLADLDRDEITILGTAAKKIKCNKLTYTDYDQALDDALVEIYGTKQELDGLVKEQKATYRYQAVLGGLQRTGFVSANVSGWNRYSYGRQFSLTSRFDELINYISNWEDIATWNWSDK